MYRGTERFILLVLLTALVAMAQQPAPGPPNGGPPRGGPPERGFQHGPPGMDGGRPPMDRGFRGGPPGRWWTDPAMVEKLALTSDQQKRIDDLFQQNRLKLIDVSAALQKEEAILDPLLGADHPEESKVLVQIDRIAQARAELEKANARMLLGFRNTLTPDQWKKLQTGFPRPFSDHRR